MEIQIDVRNKVAMNADPTKEIVCGNSDYVIQFNFDDEWARENVKTARFVYEVQGKVRHTDVVFTGSVVSVPKLLNINSVYVGVFAGDLRTTTPAKVYCSRSIVCQAGTPAEPSPDVYAQIIELCDQAISEKDEVLIVTPIGGLVENSGLASHNAGQIRDHVLNGGTAIFKAKYSILQLDYVRDTTVTFSHIYITANSITIDRITIDDTGAYTKEYSSHDGVTYTPYDTPSEEQKAQARQNIGAADSKSVNKEISRINTKLSSISDLIIIGTIENDIVTLSNFDWDTLVKAVKNNRTIKMILNSTISEEFINQYIYYFSNIYEEEGYVAFTRVTDVHFVDCITVTRNGKTNFSRIRPVDYKTFEQLQENSVLTTKQELTNEQKAQARVNIGALENPCITGRGAPTIETKGAVGCLYMDTYTGLMYKCTSVNDFIGPVTYSWELLGTYIIDITFGDEMGNVTLSELFPFRLNVDFDEVWNAYTDGSEVVFRIIPPYGNVHYTFYLTCIFGYGSGRALTFIGYDPDESETDPRLCIITIEETEDGDNVHLEEHNLRSDTSLTGSGCYADAATVGKKLGNIETALDGIIDIQKRLAGEKITFIISGNPHTAIYGTTWSRWCDTPYNVFGFCVHEDGYVYSYEGEPLALVDGELQTGEMVIVDGAKYISL